MQNDVIAPPHNNTHNTKPPKEGWRSIISTILILLAAPLIAIFLTGFVFQSYEVDGPSMETTLQNGDRLIVWKLGKTWDRLTGQTYVPKRGDIVVFHRPPESANASEGDKQLIKRVVALPGERVNISNKVLTVFNDEHPDGFQPDHTGLYTLSDATTERDVDLIVPEGEVFVCGDNRDNSLDSRSFGPISTDLVVGNLAMRLYPLGNIQTY